MHESRQSLTVSAPAKLNLSLRILARLESGYHQLKTVITPLSLCDRISLEMIPSGIEFTCNLSPQLRTHIEACKTRSSNGDYDQIVDNLASPQNLVLRAVELIYRAMGVAKDQQGLRINLEKNIPFGAGLGGGSSDAAATLLAVNDLMGFEISFSDLLTLASELGSDVPALLYKKTVLASGVGDKTELIEELSLPEELSGDLLIVKPPIHGDTKQAYELLDQLTKSDQKSKSKKLLQSGRELYQPIEISNDFSGPMRRFHPELDVLFRRLSLFEAGRLVLAGSGTAVALLCRTRDEARQIETALIAEGDRQGWFVWRGELMI